MYIHIHFDILGMIACFFKKGDLVISTEKKEH